VPVDFAIVGKLAQTVFQAVSDLPATRLTVVLRSIVSGETLFVDPPFQAGLF
jgi:hypothetical protein